MVPDAPPEPLDRALRERVFAWLDPARIVHEDDAIIAIDKPAGVPTQPARADAADDLPARVARFLEARGDRGEPYVGVHQRLDKETSGLVLYTKQRSANARIAHQIEGRVVAKRYLACVEQWDGPARTTLRDRIAPGEDGRMIVASRGDRRGKDAITHVEVKARGARGRTLLELRIETGRTHQIRTQLAHAGAPVAGDALYGGALASRLMLHSSQLRLDHPVTGIQLALGAPTPPEFEAWLGGRDHEVLDDPALLRAALARALERRFALGRAALRPEPERTSAFRWVHEAGDGVPGVAVDVYADWLVLHLYGDEAEAREDTLADALHEFGFAGIYVKRRPRKASDLGAEGLAALAPSAPIRGRAAPDELVVREHGLRFAVRLGDGMSTGVFLDQRAHRARVRAMAAERSVLNLFAYTCGFGVAAAAGGAARTVDVDASAAALARGRRNYELAGASGETVHADVFEWLERARRRGEKFDLVCCDPPTYSTTKKARWTSGKQWRALGGACFGVLAPGGTLLATSNDRRMTQRAFRAEIREGARSAGVALESLRDLGPPEDFPWAIGDEPHLKGVLAVRAR